MKREGKDFFAISSIIFIINVLVGFALYEQHVVTYLIVFLILFSISVEFYLKEFNIKAFKIGRKILILFLIVMAVVSFSDFNLYQKIIVGSSILGGVIYEFYWYLSIKIDTVGSNGADPKVINKPKYYKK